MRCYGHLASKDHKKAMHRHILADILVGLPALRHPVPFTDLHQVSCRGESNFQNKNEDGNNGMPGPLSVPRLKEYWGENIATFGATLLDRIRHNQETILCHAGAKKKTIAVEWSDIEDITTAVVEYIGDQFKVSLPLTREPNADTNSFYGTGHVKGFGLGRRCFAVVQTTTDRSGSGDPMLRVQNPGSLFMNGTLAPALDPKTGRRGDAPGFRVP